MFKKKIALSIMTVLLASMFTFFLIRLIPGDVVSARAFEISTAEQIPYDQAYIRAEQLYGRTAEENVILGYLKYISSIARGDLGESIVYRMPVKDVIVKAVPWTIFVSSIAITISFIIGTKLGLYGAHHRKNRKVNGFISIYASITDATPDFITAIILVMIFAIGLKWLPIRGAYDSAIDPGFSFDFIKSVGYHALLPILSFVIENLGGWALLMRSTTTAVLGDEYITVARAKGLKERTILKRYVAPNAILTPVSMLALRFGAMIGGAALIENVFAYPGIGFFITRSVADRDYTMIQGLFLMTTVTMVIATLVSDVIYMKLDPRVRE